MLINLALINYKLANIKFQSLYKYSNYSSTYISFKLSYQPNQYLWVTDTFSLFSPTCQAGPLTDNTAFKALLVVLYREAIICKIMA